MAGLIKRSYRTIATLALLNFLALGGGVGYLVASGRLDTERARRVADVLRGEEEEPETAESEQSEIEKTLRLRRTGASVVSKDEQRIRDEIAWRNAERYRTQLEQRLKFINAERLDVDRRREEFDRLRNEERIRREEASKNSKEPGYVKELDVLRALSPRTALRQLMTMNDADVARILFELDTRRTKKIVEAAKTDIQRSKIASALLLMRDFKRVDEQGASDPSGG